MSEAVEVINPDRLYTVPEVAAILALHPNTVYTIPEQLLRRTRVGPRRGRTKVRGRDLLAYLDGKAA